MTRPSPIDAPVTSAARQPSSPPAATASVPDAATASLMAKLRNVRVGLRGDLEISRHLFRGEACYIARDPITFQSHRFEPPEYDILVRIQNDRPLGAIFDELVAAGRFGADHQERFAEFVLTLHRLGFLRLPLSDDKALYRRSQLRARANRKSQLLGFLFLRVPLWNPDGFLNRTVGYVRPLFSRAAFAAWLAFVICAAFVAWRSWAELSDPLQNVLVSMNVPLLVATLLVLKVFHEFGHAYACKHYGGHVPEMGVYLILFTPCAYVDATASWGFNRKRERLIVCLAGMYVEAAIAAAAVFVWQLSDGVLVRSIAHHVIFLASAVTVLFNINPLMRYDGYYILSDLVEVPNLRQKSRDYVAGIAKRVLLGVRDSREILSKRLRAILGGYGIASMVYRVSLLLAIATILALKFSMVGLAIGVLVIASAVLGGGLKLTSYLLRSPETASRRARAVSLAALTFLLLPVAVMWMPMPSSVFASGVIATEHEAVVRVRTPGVLEHFPLEPGAAVRAGESLGQLSNELVRYAVQAAGTSLAAHRIRTDALRTVDRSQFQQAEAQLPAKQGALDEALTQAEQLDCPSPIDGVIVQRLRPTELGRYLTPGTPLAMIAAGAWQVRTVLTAEQIASAHPELGSVAEFRSTGDPARSFRGVVSRITPRGTRQVPFAALTHLGGGDVAVDPAAGATNEPYFEITITLEPVVTSGADDGDAPPFFYGMTGSVRFAGHSEPIGTTLARRVLRFWNKLRSG